MKEGPWTNPGKLGRAGNSELSWEASMLVAVNDSSLFLCCTQQRPRTSTHIVRFRSHKYLKGRQVPPPLTDGEVGSSNLPKMVELKQMRA